MTEIVGCKFTQNCALKARLNSCGNQVLQEATLDGFWGTNSSLRSKATRESNGSGQNKLGIILSQIREELIKDKNTVNVEAGHV